MDKWSKEEIDAEVDVCINDTSIDHQWGELRPILIGYFRNAKFFTVRFKGVSGCTKSVCQTADNEGVNDGRRINLGAGQTVDDTKVKGDEVVTNPTSDFASVFEKGLGVCQALGTYEPYRSRPLDRR